MDVIAGLIELYGLWMNGNKDPLSFIWFIIANLMWIIVAVHTHLYGLLLVSIPAIIINMRNYKKWNNK